MFPKKNRVSKKEINQIFKDGFFINSNNLVFKFLKNEKEFNSKISFIVGKNISKKAVIRNKIRRLGYQTFKNYQKSLPFSLMGVFIFSRNSLGFLEKPKKEQEKKLQKEFEVILNKINKKT